MLHQVLLVDDEAKVLDGMRRFFNWEEAGFEVCGTALSYEEAVEKMMNAPADVVVTDISMPGKNGIDLIRTLKSLFPKAFVIILSAYSEFSYAQEALRLGALDYLTKPINFGQLRESLNKAGMKLAARTAEENGDISEQLYASRMMNLLSGYSPKNGGLNRPLIVKRTAVLRVCPFAAADALSADDVEKLCTAVHPATMLATGDREATLVCHDADDLNLLAEKAEQCLEKLELPLVCGLSDTAERDGELRKAYMQAGRAMRYQSARERSGLMAYMRLEHMFSGIDEEQEKGIQMMIGCFARSDSRASFPNLVDAYLEERQGGAAFSLANQQRFCAALAIELDAAVQHYVFTDYSRHDSLSAFLLAALSCREETALRETVKRYLNTLLEHLAAPGETDESAQLVERVKKYLEEHFSQNITLELLAENFFISPVYLSRLFKRKTGENYMRYLTALRMDKAKKLLKTSRIKVADIACMTGYDNPRYFARLFKEHNGMSPQEYRETEGKAAR